MPLVKRDWQLHEMLQAVKAQLEWKEALPTHPPHMALPDVVPQLVFPLIYIRTAQRQRAQPPALDDASQGSAIDIEAIATEVKLA